MNSTRKILFIDRDGTLIREPSDQQVDSIDKLELMPGVITALTQLVAAGYELVMVTNQDGLGSASFPEQDFLRVQNLLLKILASQGISFTSIRICPHREVDGCECRKPRLGLVADYLREQTLNREQSYVIGDRATDCELADKMGVKSLYFASQSVPNWQCVVEKILTKPRTANLSRTTAETAVSLQLNIDSSEQLRFKPGLVFLIICLSNWLNMQVLVWC